MSKSEKLCSEYALCTIMEARVLHSSLGYSTLGNGITMVVEPSSFIVAINNLNSESQVYPLECIAFTLLNPPSCVLRKGG